MLEFFKGKKVFITGHTGFKGSWLSKILIMAGADVTGYALKPATEDCLFHLLNLDKEMYSVYGDIRDLDKLSSALTVFEPEIVIHMAAQPIVRESYKNPVYTYETNVMGTVNILDAVKNCKSVKSFLNVTTDKVYKSNDGMWGYRENEELCGYDPYSNSKSCSELVTFSYLNSFYKDLPVAVSTARSGNVIGGGDFASDRIIPDCVRSAIQKQDIIVRNPHSIRPYQHVLECLKGYLLIVEKQYNDKKFAGNYNFGPKEELCVKTGELVSLFCEKWQNVNWVDKYDGGPYEASFLKLDSSKSNSILGWKSKWNISETMDYVVEWYKEYATKGDIISITEKQILEYFDEIVLEKNKFNNEDEKTARANILKSVADYYQKFMNISEPYKEGQKICYASRVFDEKEMTNLVDSALDFWLTSGRYTNEFEKKIAAYLGIKYCSFVNSGSSANLCAFMALTSPLLEERMIKKGDEVITVACGFPTTIAPIIQYGAVPVFVDVTIPEYNINVTKLEQALSKKTKAVMIAHTLGNPFDLTMVRDFCDKNHLWLVEDNCDALGSKYLYNGKWQYTGTIGDIGTSSFYPPHHMTTGEGGAVYTNNPLLNKIIKSFRDWGRECACPSGVDNLCNHRFDGQFGELPKGYDHKYVYSHFGYNLKATDLQASIGCAQIDKLSGFTEKRIHNFELLLSLLKKAKIDDKVILPVKDDDKEPSWFGFLITCKENVDRNQVTKYLEDCNIQTRLLFAGNIIKHPCFDYIRDNKKAYRIVDSLDNTDIITEKTFWVGLYPGMTDEKINYMAKKIIEAINR